MIRVNAVLGKELTTRMRGWRSSLVITAYMTLLAGIVLIYLGGINDPQSFGESATIGKNLFGLLAGFQMALIIFITPASTADAISGERQRQTLDLLLVTRLSSLSIVLGKLVAGLAFDVLLILCSIPLFSLVFLFGGISPTQFLSLFTTFLVTTVLLGSMALFISTLMRRSGASIIVSMLATLGLTVGVGLLSIFLAFSGFGASTSAGSIPLPAYADPILGLMATLPDADWNTTIDHFTAGPLNLSVWQDQMIVDVVLAIIFIVGSVRLLRPQGSA